MKQDIRLYLSGKRADLKEDPKLLFNYKITDTEAPAAVKNAYSKTVTLEGTDNNNAIFGEIYDLSRLQQYGAGGYSGAEFNPLKKAEFTLYIDSDIFESGYFKLNDITKTKGNITYNVTLYGGLGEFLYNLQEAEGGNKLEFKDLNLYRDTEGNEPIPDLGFNVTKETIDNAWNNIQNYSSRYSTLNFVPCYNGVPADFDSDHVLINLHNHSYDLNNITGMYSYHYWAKGEASRELTEWETRDLRSHLQRPALRVKHLLNSICSPDNNGGYKVELDPHFFNPENPYYEETFVTLNLIKDINGDSEDNVTLITGATIQNHVARTSTYDIDTGDIDFSEFTNLNFELEINMNPTQSTNVDSYYMSTWKDITPDFTLLSRFIRDYEWYSAILVQLVAYDELGKEVAQSAAYQITSQVPGKGTPDFTPLINSSATVSEWKTLYGYFAKSGDTYTFVDNQGNPTRIKFSFPSSTSFRTLKLRWQRPYFENYKYTFMGGSVKSRYGDGGGYMWQNTYEKFQDNLTLSEIHALRSASMLENLQVRNFTANATRYGGFTSGKYIPQSRILTLGVTPADFLLSYTKLFGLYIWKDPVEKKIFIADRDTYYKRDEVIDLHGFIDRDKAIKITPQVAKAKWYDFNTEQHDSEANGQYMETYGGTDFGLQRVNTSFDFDSNTISVYDGEFKGGIQVLENSPYYYNDFDGWPVYCYNGFTLTTYALSGTVLEGTEQTVNTMSDVKYYPINAEHNGFDLFDKPQFHGEDNDSAEGNLTLVFFNKMVDTLGASAGFINYWLTDDIEEMVSLNDKTPCWIMTDSDKDSAGNTIAIRRDTIPQFSRYKIFEGNGRITHTLDYGKTLETYIPDSVLTNGCSIYEKCWQDYIADMYDVNSRILNCYVLIRGQVNPEWLRRFYFFDNSYWRLNQVKEWNPGVYGSTNCEFLKVNDLNNYSLTRITGDADIDFLLPDNVETAHAGNERYYTIQHSVTQVTADIIVEDGGSWYFGDGPGSEYQVTYDGANGDTGWTEYYPYTGITLSGADSGMGNTQETFLIGLNSGTRGKTYRFNIVVYGNSGTAMRFIYLRQEPSAGQGYINIQRFAGSGNVPPIGGHVMLAISCTYPWTASTQYSYTTLDKTTGHSLVNVEMSVAENTGDYERPCSVTVTDSNGNSSTFSVDQNGVTQIPSLAFTSDNYIFSDPAGQTINGAVQCPTGYTGGWEVTNAPSWITVSPASGGTGVTHIAITASANTGEERQDTVYITGGGETELITFIQKGWEAQGIKIELQTYNLPQQGGTYGAKVTSSVNGWTLDSSAWITPSINGGNAGITNFTVTVNPNNLAYGRVGYIVARGGSYADQASITQDA